MGTPHLDLLDRLEFEDLDLHQSAFLSIHPFPDVDSARSAVLNFVADGLVELYSADLPDTAIHLNDVKWILEVNEYWDAGTAYNLRITARGLQWRWGKDRTPTA